MSNKALSWAFGVQIPHGPKFVLVTYADEAREERGHKVWLTQAELSRRTCISISTLYRYKIKLVEWNLLIPAGKAGATGRVDCYRVAVGGVLNLPPQSTIFAPPRGCATSRSPVNALSSPETRINSKTNAATRERLVEPVESVAVTALTPSQCGQPEHSASRSPVNDYSLDSLTTLKKSPSGQKNKRRPRPRGFLEAADYFEEKGSTEFEAKKWFTSKEANGWKQGKNSIKDWKASARTWIMNQPQYSKSSGSGKLSLAGIATALSAIED